ncbi:MAG: Sec-independent protein translocase protein TatB [Rubrivivax sp.]|jgi:sec-independent protein translocase protein TatB|nr:Sec-independent protein translocase protein TatB [Rubrivivax sp.]
MMDFGFDKIALIGAVALIVLGPEKLPRVARTVGHLLGKAQRYVSDVKAEVNRSIELDELKKMRSTVEDAARDVQSSVQGMQDNLNREWSEATAGLDGSESTSSYDPLPLPPPSYRPPKKNWRVKRGRTPMWFKQQQGVRSKVQSGAARVARHRPARKA